MSGENRDQVDRKAAPNCPAGRFQGLVSVGEGRTQIEMQADPLGGDWLLRVTGGRAHVGAVATAGQGVVQLSVVGSHKEGPLAQVCAEQWALLTGRVCVAVAGIHQDQATSREIDRIVENVRAALEILKVRWREAHHLKQALH